jgi:hypothetical protein
MTQAYQRKFAATFGRAIRANIIRLVKDQQTDVLAEVGTEAGVALAPFTKFNRAIHRQVSTPCFTVYRRATRKINTENDQLLESTPEFGLVATVEGKDEDEAHDLVEVYAEVVDRIVRSAADEDLYQDLPDGVKGLTVLEITDHLYIPAVPVGTRCRQAVELVGRFTITEA